MITTPDGKKYSDSRNYELDESYIDEEKCYLKFEEDSLEGDLIDYHIVIHPIQRNSANTNATDSMVCTSVKGVGVDLQFKAVLTPFRHGAGRTVFNKQDDLFSSWFCIPKMQVTGSITIEGERRIAEGTGYHDHRCMAIDDMRAWHHWLWGRQFFQQYSCVIYDLVTSKEFDFIRIPLFCIYDQNGSIIFDNNGSVNCNIKERYLEPVGEKEYPKLVEYHFTDGTKEAIYTLECTKAMEVRDLYSNAPEQMKKVFDSMEMQPSYACYQAEGQLTIKDNGQVVAKTEKSPMVYEFAYQGKPNTAAHL
ncbi:hypothetical protein [Clostridium tyrobutyricum]|uniref:hypothetical protein n=1 Tax=Clostridium tyrobutyricum TaxID=1519 RepID=UPI001C38A730|nr:hypothetical protein [Clostridium tyrobutyricum]MBV4429657.1 hypothetical protein [Clostridium tyrobutyricum]MBV4444884.1 hypothetical protein [Clostridium tyrobutyricum]